MNRNIKREMSYNIERFFKEIEYQCKGSSFFGNYTNDNCLRLSLEGIDHDELWHALQNSHSLEEFVKTFRNVDWNKSNSYCLAIAHVQLNDLSIHMESIIKEYMPLLKLR